MILDTSAIVAILLTEPGYGALVDAIETQFEVGVGAPTLLETAMVLTSRRGAPAKTTVARFRDEMRVQTIAFDEVHWEAAYRAFLRFGKGRHPAALNFGDCCSYATAQIARRPLLFVGNDFPRTDLDLVRPAG